jgi:hypothetical protein
MNEIFLKTLNIQNFVIYFEMNALSIIFYQHHRQFLIQWNLFKITIFLIVFLIKSMTMSNSLKSPCNIVFLSLIYWKSQIHWNLFAIIAFFVFNSFKIPNLLKSLCYCWFSGFVLMKISNSLKSLCYYCFSDFDSFKILNSDKSFEIIVFFCRWLVDNLGSIWSLWDYCFFSFDSFTIINSLKLL